MKREIRIIKKVFTFKRLLNLELTYSGYFLSNLLKRAIVLGMPPSIMIEPTNICNLSCPLCPSGNGTLSRAKGYMEFSIFKKAIDEVKDYTSLIFFWNQGEPFLNTGILDMVNYASENKMYTYLSSNLNIIPDAEELVRSGLDELIISMDGTNQESYNKYRVNGELDKVISNIKKIVEAKKKLKSNLPFLRLQFIIMKHNENEIGQIKEMAKVLEVDKLELKTAQIYSKEDVENFLPFNPKYRRYKITVDKNFELKFKFKNKCLRIWTNPVINWNGEVSVCCYDKDIDVKVGTLKESSFKSIWHGKKFMKFRNSILKNRASFAMCKNCGEGVSLRIKNK